MSQIYKLSKIATASLVIVFNLSILIPYLVTSGSTTLVVVGMLDIIWHIPMTLILGKWACGV